MQNWSFIEKGLYQRRIYRYSGLFNLSFIIIIRIFQKIKHFENTYITYFVRYIYIQDQLLIQRSLYKRLKEENELNRKRIFLANVEYFRRNHAAKIIQRNWKLYCARVPWKKRKSRKLACS